MTNRMRKKRNTKESRERALSNRRRRAWKRFPSTLENSETR